MSKRRKKGRRPWQISAFDTRMKSAAGTTMPLPLPEPKVAKIKKKKEKRRRWPLEIVAEPRHEEFFEEDRHIATIIFHHADGPMKPMRAMRTTLDPYHQRKAREEYGGRNELLRRMGYGSYADYTAGPLWATIRARVLGRSSGCVLCGRRACQVHHLRYTKEVLLGQDDRQLVAICRRCHYSIEFRERDGVKLSPRQVRAKLNYLITMRRERESNRAAP